MRTLLRPPLLLTAIFLAVVVVTTAAASTVSDSLWAAGGTAPESAPLAVPGTTYSGDTSSDPVGTAMNINCCRDITSSEWWNVELTNGEQVLIKGQVTTRFKAMIYQPGTTSLKIRNAHAKQQYIPALTSDDLDAGVLYKATLTGTYPIAIGPVDNGEGSEGPFNFTVTIYKDAFLFVPRTVNASTTKGNTLAVSVRDKEGTPISDATLTIHLTGIWRNAPGAAASAHPLASGHPTRGKVIFRYRVPRGYKGTTPLLAIGATGAGYQAIRSVKAKLLVAK
jgi:hypothetical protein